ncbi:hypothetical protein HY642_07055 [Candidatus Woesearchaeota archaeon]|nr:hypothetical protein [Candidatus Woesearchaeota archaeon]
MALDKIIACILAASMAGLPLEPLKQRRAACDEDVDYSLEYCAYNAHDKTIRAKLNGRPIYIEYSFKFERGHLNEELWLRKGEYGRDSKVELTYIVDGCVPAWSIEGDADGVVDLFSSGDVCLHKTAEGYEGTVPKELSESYAARANEILRKYRTLLKVDEYRKKATAPRDGF